MHSLFIFDLENADERKIAQELIDRFNKVVPEQKLPVSNRSVVQEGISFKQPLLATGKQKSFMVKLGLKFDDNISMDEASGLISKETERRKGLK